MSFHALPERSLRLIPDQAKEYQLFFDGQNDGNNQASWIDQSHFHFRCTVYPGGVKWPYCGLQIFLGDNGVGRDFSRYDRLLVRLDYNGENPRVRLFMRNFNPIYSTVGEQESLKGMDVVVLKSELDKLVEILPSEWKTSEYWLSRNNITRQLNNAEFTNIVQIGVDLVPPFALGDHEIKITELELRGDLLPADKWYLGVILTWLTITLSFMVRYLLTLNNRVIHDSDRLSTLANYSDALRNETEKYKEMSTVDNLTGVLNRNGLATYMSSHYPSGRLGTQVSMLVLDLDHFKRINDKKGHDAGDAVLSQVAHAIRETIRSSDCLTRWGGEEFILLCPNTSEHEALLVAEKLRGVIAALIIAYRESHIRVTASIGLGTASQEEDFDALFHRVDQALYKAKHLGRNCVVVADPVQLDGDIDPH